MADVVAIRAALQRLDFSAPAALLITDDQAIDSVQELTLLEDKEVENLCRVLRRPGGTIPNPQAAVVGAPALIGNPGTQVSLRAENNMKFAVYFLKHRTRTSRATTAADITLDQVQGIRNLRQEEENHDDVEAPKLDNRDWPKTMEAIIEYLRGCL